MEKEVLSKKLFSLGFTKKDVEEFFLDLEKNDFDLFLMAPHYCAIREVVEFVIPRNRNSFLAASEELRGDKDLALLAVAENALLLKSVSVELKSDRDVVLAAVSEYGLALEFANMEFRNDKEVVLRALGGCPDSLVGKDLGRFLWDVWDLASDELWDLVGDDDPAVVLAFCLDKERLDASLSQKNAPIKKIKI